MNGLGDIQENIKSFVYERKQAQEEIRKIEEKRTELAEKRNQVKAYATKNEIDELGRQISELGNQSQELQNKLDFKFYEKKSQIGASIDNLIAEGIRQIRKIDEEAKEIEEKIALQEERSAKYEIQKSEFLARFGRIPELSENAIKQNKDQKSEILAGKNQILEIKTKINEIEEQLAELARIKQDFKNKNWTNIISKEETTELVLEQDISFENMEEFFKEDAAVLPVVFEDIEEIEDVYIESIEPIEELKVEKFEPVIEEIEVDEIEPIEELNIEPMVEIEELQVEEFNPVEEIKVENVEEVHSDDPIEKIARSIVEEIVAEQTKEINIDKIEEDIITFEENVEEVPHPVFEEKAILSNIIAKIEDGEIVYKAQVSDGKEIKVFPTKTSAGNQLLRDRQIREDLKEILINYAVSEHKALDKKIIKKIDPTVCEILVLFANKYNYNAQNLIYNYAMSFSKREDYEADVVLPSITYNLSYLNGTYLSPKEKAVISKICKNGVKNNKIDLIGNVTGISKIKYLLKRIFAMNNSNALPEGKNN